MTHAQIIKALGMDEDATQTPRDRVELARQYKGIYTFVAQMVKSYKYSMKAEVIDGEVHIFGHYWTGFSEGEYNFGLPCHYMTLEPYNVFTNTILCLLENGAKRIPFTNNIAA